MMLMWFGTEFEVMGKMTALSEHEQYGSDGDNPKLTTLHQHAAHSA